ncbi:hypothetical protein JJB07_18465 [Tumebacillus sp. ITR2]|uniref:Uncharacterized protein n=1 Tax=Tumebacillus amylolyticus TaxID=2801339 RepID=A0ABS1JE69_9BACL|nr:hypothetical protein [Tumebacillus amylolyticus]MBL0388592.1 hypothetical protein [Tumebacillus amylolyticus]
MESTWKSKSPALQKAANQPNKTLPAKQHQLLQLQQAYGNRAVMQWLKQGKKGTVAQGSFEHVNNAGKNDESFSFYAEWDEEYEKVNGHSVSKTPGYVKLFDTKVITFHVNVEDTSEQYLKKVREFMLAVRDGLLEQPYEAVIGHFPELILTRTASSVIATTEEGPTVRLNELQTDPEDQKLSGARKAKLATLVPDAKSKLTALVGSLETLMKARTIENAGTTVLYNALKRIIKMEDKNADAALGILHSILSLMLGRLNQPTLEVSTMNRSERMTEPTTLGKSGPKSIRDNWELEGSKFEPWLKWLTENRDFGGDIRLRMEAAQLEESQSSNLLHTFIHELSHATASTRDFAYESEVGYFHLDWLENLGNADTIANVVKSISAVDSETYFKTEDPFLLDSENPELQKKLALFFEQSAKKESTSQEMVEPTDAGEEVEEIDFDSI